MSDAPAPGLALEGGYHVVVTREGEAGRAAAVALAAPGGQLLVTIEMTPAGPAIRLSGARVELQAPELSLACDDLSLRARRSATLEVGGELREIAGSKTSEIAGAARLSAREVAVRAREGGLDLEANDDIRAQGERVLLNADTPPMPLSWEEYAARRKAAGGGAPLPPGGADADASSEDGAR